MDRYEAQTALDAVKDTDRLMAERMTWPLWRHAIVGVMMAALLLGIALPFEWQVPISGLVLLMVYVVIRDDKKRYGMFVSGYQKGRTGWVLAIQFALFIAAMLISNTFVDEPLQSPLFWGIEVILLAGSTALSLLWEKVYQADLKAGRA